MGWEPLQTDSDKRELRLQKKDSRAKEKNPFVANMKMMEVV